MFQAGNGAETGGSTGAGVGAGGGGAAVGTENGAAGFMLGPVDLAAGFALGAAFVRAAFLGALLADFAAARRDFFAARAGRAFFLAVFALTRVFLAFATGRFFDLAFFDLPFFDLVFLAMVNLLLAGRCNTWHQSSPEKVRCHLHCVLELIARIAYIGRGIRYLPHGRRSNDSTDPSFI